MSKHSLTNDKKNDDKNKVGTEKLVLDAFERFFAFEFYLRYLGKDRPKDLRRIQLLKKLAIKKFGELDTINKLSECNLHYPGGPECIYPIDFELHDLVDWTLDALQFSNISLDNLYYDFDFGSLQLSDKTANLLFRPFNDLKRYVKPSQRNLSYRFSYLANPNNIRHAFNWWQKCLDNDSFYKSFECYGLKPFEAPNVIFFRSHNYSIQSSGESGINIDGRKITNSVVLSVRFDEDFQNLDEILGEFVRDLRGHQGGWVLDKMNSGVFPDLALDDPVRSVGSKPKLSSQYCRIVDQYNSIAKNLIGLMCYDEAKNIEKPCQGIKPKALIIKAADNVSESIRDILERDTEVILKDYYAVVEKISTIDEVIKHKQHSYKSTEK